PGPEDGRRIARFRALAQAKGAALAINVIAEHGDFRTNVTRLYDRRGALVAAYDKVHPTGVERRTMNIRPGDRPVVADLDGVRVGFLTCFDLSYPELAESLAALSPDLVLCPSTQRGTDSGHAIRQAQIRATDMDAYLVRASYSMGPSSATGGQSLIVDPVGSVMCNLGQSVGVVQCGLDPKRKILRPASYGQPDEAARAILARHRNPEAYLPAGPGCVPPLAAAVFPRLVAHRGLPESCPENSLPGLAAAMACGAAELEFDVRRTADGVLVLCHDARLDRVSDRRGLIAEMDWADVAQADIGIHHPGWAGTRVARLDEALRQLAGRVHLNVHIKLEPGQSDALVRETADLLRDCRCAPHAYLAGDARVLEIARTAAPDLARCCLEAQEEPDRLLDAAIRYECARVQFFASAITEEHVARAKAHGLRVNVFYADEPDQARALFALGADAVLTNRLPALRIAAGQAAHQGV
nr:glycerophosphodiester phosphodiesterase family protein [Clostridia bacterium]